MSGYAKITIDGGAVGVQASAYDYSHVVMYNGLFYAVTGLVDHAMMDIHGGILSNYMEVRDYALLNIHGFSMNDEAIPLILATGDSQINLFAASTLYDEDARVLSGRFLDGSPFAIGISEDSMLHVAIIPEPDIGLSFFALASLLLARRRVSSHWISASILLTLTVHAFFPSRMYASEIRNGDAAECHSVSIEPT